MFFYNKINSKKFKKFNLKGTKQNKKKLCFGFSGLQSLDTGRLSTKQIETCIQTLRKKLKPLDAKIWVRINPNISVTKKASSVRMGKGKGAIDRYVAFVRKGQVLFEISKINKSNADRILRTTSSKLPIKTQIIHY